MKKKFKVLKNLFEKPKSEFELKPVNVNQVYEVIQKSKASNSMGHDNLSMNIIKEIPQFMALAMNHLYNYVIKTGVYPACLKTSRIIHNMNTFLAITPVNIVFAVLNLLTANVTSTMGLLMCQNYTFR